MNLLRSPRSTNWYIDIRDPMGKLHRIAGFEDKRLTTEYARKIEIIVNHAIVGANPPADLLDWLSNLQPQRQQQLAKANLVPKRMQIETATLDAHLLAYEAHLKSRNFVRTHVISTKQQCRNIIEGIGAKAIANIKPDAVEQFLLAKRDAGMSISTSNHWLVSIKSFLNWCVKSEPPRIPKNPLASIKNLAHSVDVRVKRRALSIEESGKLLAATLNGPPRRRTRYTAYAETVTGRDRYWLYRFILETGLRLGEVESLKPSSFDWKASTCTVEAAYSRKSKETRRVALRAKTAKQLWEYLARRDPDAWAFIIADHPVDALREDLKAAGIECVDSSGHKIDLHALRHTHATLAASVSKSARGVQDMLGHRHAASSATYVHDDLMRVRQIVDALPDWSESVSAGVSKSKNRVSVPVSAKKREPAVIGGHQRSPEKRLNRRKKAS